MGNDGPSYLLGWMRCKLERPAGGSRAEGEGKMTGQTPYLSRYLVRMGNKGWMVWDRQRREPARLEGGRPVIELSEERAREIRDELNKNDIADG